MRVLGRIRIGQRLHCDLGEVGTAEAARAAVLPTSPKSLHVSTCLVLVVTCCREQAGQ
jgi:hypothetical protein